MMIVCTELITRDSRTPGHITLTTLGLTGWSSEGNILLTNNQAQRAPVRVRVTQWFGLELIIYNLRAESELITVRVHFRAL